MGYHLKLRSHFALFLFLSFTFLSNAHAVSCVEAVTSVDRANPLGRQTIPDPHYNLRPDGQIWITGTGLHYLVYKNTQAYLAGEIPEPRKFRLLHSDADEGIPLSEENGESPWGIVVQNWKDVEGQNIDVLYAGVMVPQDGKANAQWPDDNVHRRIVAFVKNPHGDWVSQGPCFGLERGWENHAYDIDFFTGTDGVTWAYYAKVDEIKNGRPVRTQIYARKMRPGKAGSQPRFDDQETLVLGVGPDFLGKPSKPFPSTVRASNKPLDPLVSLVEGPRVREVYIPLYRVAVPIEKNWDGRRYIRLRINGNFHRVKVEGGHVRLLIMGLSANDFELPTYGAHFAIGFSATDFVPFLTDDGSDLKNFNAVLGLNANARTAVGRPNPVQINGKMDLLFHAALSLPTDVHDLNNLQRRPYRVPFELSIARIGEIQFDSH